MDVIVESAYGNIKIFEASIENAYKLFDIVVKENFIPVPDWNPPYFSKEMLVEKAERILNSPIGTDIDGLLLTKEIKESFILFLFENNIQAIRRHFESHKFMGIFSFEKLPFFREFNVFKDKNDIKFLNASTFDMNKKYQNIKQKKFKDDISDKAIISYILQFLNSIVISTDIEYELCPIEDIV